jgi:hypothetical protein
VKIKKPKQYPDKSIIKGALRRVFARSPMIKSVLTDSVHPFVKGPKGGKQYICANCSKTYAGNKVAVDHIYPVIPLHLTVHDLDYNEMVKRIFCDKSNLQVLCEGCHKDKTRSERIIRNESKKKRRELENGRNA